MAWAEEKAVIGEIFQKEKKKYAEIESENPDKKKVISAKFKRKTTFGSDGRKTNKKKQFR